MHRDVYNLIRGCEAVLEVERISSMVSRMALREQHMVAAIFYFALSRHLFLVCIFNFLK